MSALTADYMLPAEFRAIRTALGLTQAELARALDKTVRTIIRYEQGFSAIPDSVTIALKAMMTDMQAVEPAKAAQVQAAVVSWLKSDARTAKQIEVLCGRIRLPDVQVEVAQFSRQAQSFGLVVPTVSHRLCVIVRAAVTAAPVTIAGALITALELEAISAAEGTQA